MKAFLLLGTLGIHTPRAEGKEPVLSRKCCFRSNASFGTLGMPCDFVAADAVTWDKS